MQRQISFRVKSKGSDVPEFETESVADGEEALWIHDGPLEVCTFKFKANGSISANRQGCSGGLSFQSAGDLHPEIPFNYEYISDQGVLAVYYGDQLRATMKLWSPHLPPGELPDTKAGGLMLATRVLLKSLAPEERGQLFIEFCPGCMKWEGDKAPDQRCNCYREADPKPVAAATGTTDE
jgi:hypothetical protein